MRNDYLWLSTLYAWCAPTYISEHERFHCSDQIAEQSKLCPSHIRRIDVLRFRWYGTLNVPLNADGLVTASGLDPMSFLRGRKRLRTGVSDNQSLSATRPVILIIENSGIDANHIITLRWITPKPGHSTEACVEQKANIIQIWWYRLRW